ncbi:T9SS type B sorting domain-containing protein [Brumimicrobium mesophilum]|uniref:T9SS type B sorting domain-containing protein n=1 Tax=Brumimicrobium mesophilum TaxID=392717 RepID=UPI000D141F48|nr:gliding motility-associated C-terminal domain-containing protein [Brumimicrobium mesophilum]
MKSKVKILALLMLGFSSFLGAQISPGGIGTVGLTSWFRADDLNAGNVTTWTTQFPMGTGAVTVTDPQAPYPQLEITPTGSISNYNRTISFTGNTYVGQNISTVQGLQNTTPPTLLANASISDQGTFFCSYYMPTPPSGNGHLSLYNNGSTGLQVRNLTATGRIGLGLSFNSLNASRDYIEDFKPNITSYKGNRSNATSLKAYNKGGLLSSNVASQSSGSNGLYFGYSPTIGSSAYNGFLHEILFFNRDLTDLEMSKVRTYLAIKYGVTIKNIGGGANGDYVATDGTIIWDASVTPDYHNDVIGIGRDDVEDLYQKQSHSFDDVIRVYIDDLVAANEDNVGVISTDISYVTLGHDNGDLCGSIASNSEAPSPISSRIARELKVTNTDFNQDFNLDIELNPCSPITNIDVSKLRLLVDLDGDFTDASLFSQTNGISFTENNGTITVSGISTTLIPMNDTRYITIGYIDESYQIVESSGPICEGEQAWVIFEVLNANNPVDIEYSIGGNQFTASNVVDGDTLFLSPSVTTDYLFTPFVGIINCCSANSDQLFNQVVNPLPVITLDSFDDTPCDGDAMTLTANGGGTYSWNNNVVNAIPFIINLADAGIYEVTVTSAFGCVSILDTLIDVKENPIITLIDEVNQACDGDMVTLTADGAETYEWTPIVTNGVPFQVTEGTINYEVIGTDANGCTGNLNSTIVVYPSPIADFTPDTTSGVAPMTINFTDNSSNAVDYFWDFGNGNNSTFPGDETETYENGGVYPVILYVQNGVCRDSLTQIINLESPDIKVVLPNIFTPNGDGSNDLYKITADNVATIEGFILNRWGVEVYSFDSIDFEWSGDNITDGVYFIKYNAVGKNGENLEGHGYIHVNR